MDGIVSEVFVRSCLEVTVQEQHEKGEGEIERNDTCAMNLSRHLSHAFMYTRMKMCEVRSECAVRQVSVCTLLVLSTLHTLQNISRRNIHLSHLWQR